MPSAEASRGQKRLSCWVVFKRLAQDFEGLTPEFREFVEEEDAVVGDADFARGGNHAAADEADVGDGVVGGAEGARGDETVGGIE